MSVIANLFSAAMYAFVLQNLIFTGGYGASEAVRMAAKPKQLFPLTAIITFFSTFGSIFCVLLEQIPFISALSEIQHSLIFLLVICILYVLMLILLKAVFKAKKRTVRRLGVAAFNTLVLAVPFINYRATFGIAEAIGVGIGSGLAFIVAVLMINFGLRRLVENKNIPECFKGTPAVFIYVSILALAFSGVSGKGLSL